jgi:carbon monoxide dehydrogenase subunit G
VSGSVSADIDVAAGIESVWELMMDPRRLGDWVTIHREVSDISDLPLVEGSEFVQTLALAGKSFRVRWTVTRADRPEAADWEGDGPAGSRARVAYRLAASGERTHVVYENEFELPGGILGRTAGSLVRPRAERESKRTLLRLKQLLEG